MPSELESFGLAALEAMACQVVPIATDAGGVPEVIQHGKTGFLAPVGDVEAMAKYAIELLSDQEKLEDMGVSARASAQAKFCASEDHSDVRELLSRSAGAGFVERSGNRSAQFLSQQNRQHQTHQGAVVGLALDRDLGGVSVDNLQTLGNVDHANACARRAAGSRDRHADSIVFDFDHNATVG